MTEWRHSPAFNETDVGAPFGPAGEQFPGELRPPSESSNDRLQQALYDVPLPGFGADPTNQDHLAAGPKHTCTFVEPRLGMRNRGNHVICHDDVE